jgi:tripartite ATP-independent transporter DctM subunit
VSAASEPIAPGRGLVARVEEGLAASVLALMVLMPVLTVLGRWISGKSVAWTNVWTQSLNLVLCFVGATIAARTHRHLNLSTGELLNLGGRQRAFLQAFTSAVATAVTGLLAYASFDFVRVHLDSPSVLPGGVPQWVVQSVMPLGFAVMAFRLAIVGNERWPARTVALLSIGLAALLALIPEGERVWVAWVGGSVLVVAVAVGAPIYTAMGGMAMLLFFCQDFPTPIAAVPTETFTIVASPTLPALPLFTLAGYLLAEGGASRRLVNLFRHGFGWLPGGIAAAAIVVCAFFTTFTGASGVTILALGALLLPILLEAGYDERYAIGLLVASGSIGLLFPPSLPVILYGVVSHVPINDLFVAGIVPGVLLVQLLIGMSVLHGRKLGIKRGRFEAAPAVAALWEAKWEALLPVLVLVGLFGGFLTIFEAAAFTAAYAFISEVLVHRDLHWRRDVPRVFTECAVLMGGVLIILGVALGFTNFLVDAEIPMKATAWFEAHIGSKLLFILVLNLMLLVVGCLMDIYSAIMVVVPLITPIAVVFGVDPVHLGILFLANLELGYLTPPVGMNLFLASYRFERPLTEVYRLALPFLFVLLAGVLLIAYVPGLTLWALGDRDSDGGPSFQEQLEDGAEEAPALPLGELDLDALLSEDDDDSAEESGPQPDAGDGGPRPEAGGARDGAGSEGEPVAPTPAP